MHLKVWSYIRVLFIYGRCIHVLKNTTRWDMFKISSVLIGCIDCFGVVERPTDFSLKGLLTNSAVFWRRRHYQRPRCRSTLKRGTLECSIADLSFSCILINSISKNNDPGGKTVYAYAVRYVVVKYHHLRTNKFWDVR